MMRTLGDLVSPSAVRWETRVRDGAWVLAGSLLVALCAKLQLPRWPVPMTMQPFAVLLVGATLGSRRGGLALIVYLLEGALGLPVFAGPTAGLAYFTGPTAGYLLAFPLAAALVGALAERGWDRRTVSAAAALTLGHGVILSLGFAWLASGVGPGEALTTGVVPFLLGDALKIALAATALPHAWKLVQRIEHANRGDEPT